MSELSRDAAVDRLDALVETVESEVMPVPVREIWVLGDLALGLDPVERIDVYLTKDLLLSEEPDRAEQFRETHNVEGVGRTVRVDWAEAYPEYIRTNPSGHVAPEKCLAAHLLEAGEPIHLEVCNSRFENNVTQRLTGATVRENYEHILDPRGVCLWVDDPSADASTDARNGVRDEAAFEKLREGAFTFPTLADSLEMLGLDPAEAQRAASAIETYRDRQDGTTVRGDVV